MTTISTSKLQQTYRELAGKSAIVTASITGTALPVEGGWTAQ